MKRKINYGLILSDFDGTLARSDGTVSEFTKSTIQEYIKNGGRFALNTGRGTDSTLMQAEKLGLTGLVGSFQGTVITNVSTGENLVEGGLSPYDTSEIVKFTGDLHVQFYANGITYCNMRDKFLDFYEERCEVETTIVPKNTAEFIRGLKGNVYKLLYCVESEDRDKLFGALKEKYGRDFYITCSSPNYVEVCDKRYSKGTTVKFLSEYYSVPIEKTIGVGDSVNDLPMIETAGLGLAVRNAERTLKEKAVVFDKTNDEDAIAHIILKYGYEGEE